MKLKQKDISKRLGISNTLLSMIKHGKRGITYERAEYLEKLTGIEVKFWMKAEPSARWEALKNLKEA